MSIMNAVSDWCARRRKEMEILQVMSAVATAVATILLVAATVLLAVSTSKLATTAERQDENLRQQTEVLRLAEQRERARDTAQVNIEPFVKIFERAGSANKEFHGFTVTNSGFVDVTIVRGGYMLPRSPDNPIPFLNSVDLQPVKAVRNGESVADGDVFPKLLRHSESTRVMFDGDELGRRLGGHSVVTPYCWDSLGRLHAGPPMEWRSEPS